MQFQMATDYAIRILNYMCNSGDKLSTATSMAEKLGITYLYFMKIISRLKNAGMVVSVQGCNGGYRLSDDIAAVSVYDVVQAMEGGISITRCLREDHYCSRGAVEACGAHRYFQSLQDTIVKSLKDQRISQL